VINQTGLNPHGVNQEPSQKLLEDINRQITEATNLSNQVTTEWRYRQFNRLESEEEETKNTNIWPVVFLVIAISALSFSAIFTRLSQDYIGAGATVFNRCLFSTIALCSWQMIVMSLQRSRTTEENVNANNYDYTIADIAKFIGLGVSFVLCSIFWAWSLTQTSVANSNLLHNLTPIFTVLGAWLFLQQQFNKRYILGLVIAIGGTFVIGMQDLHLSASSLIGDLAALLSAGFYAGQYLFTERLAKKFDTSTIMVGMTGVPAILLTPALLLAGDQLFPSATMGWVWIACIVLISQILGQGLLARSLKRFSSSFIAIFMLLEPFFTAIFAFFIFSEQLSLTNWVAFLLVLAGIYVVKSASKTLETVEA
jgi:drug/metabolite transporter (DMT)-like permease